MKKLLIILFIFSSLQPILAQDLSRSNIYSYVKENYGTKWKYIALYFADKDTLDADNALCFEKTIQVPGKNKNELYVELNFWFLKTFSNASSKIEMADKDLGVIMAKGYFPNIAYHSGGMSSYCVNIRPIVRCDIQDEQVRLAVVIPNYEVTRVDDGVLNAIFDADYDKHPPYKVDVTWTLNQCFPFAKKDSHKRTSSEALAMTHGYVEVLFKNIEEKMTAQK